MRLARRTRRRGALDKALAFAEARAARLSAGPPLPRVAAAPRAVPRSPCSVGSLAAALPWEGRPGELGGPLDLVVVHAEGRYFGGSYELCERARRRLAAPLVVSDVLLGDAPITRAWRAGADAVSPIVRASDRLGVPLFALSEAARLRGLTLVPEVATMDELERARALGCGLVLISLRDRDTLRPCVAEVAPLFEAQGMARIALFADTLSGQDREGALALAGDERATLAVETSLETFG